MERSAERRGCSWKVQVLLGLVLVVLCCALWLLVHAVERSAARITRSNRMKQIGHALQNFHDVYKRLPPAVSTDNAGRPLCSWRSRIVPFMEAIMLDIDFGGRWYGPTNRWLLVRVNDLFCWGSIGGTSGNLHTSVVAITGEGSAFEAGKVIRLRDLDRDTILAMEVADTDIYWTEPSDLPAEYVDESTLRGIDGTGTFVIFADGTVRFLRADTPLADVKKFLTIEGAKRHDRDRVFGPEQ